MDDVDYGWFEEMLVDLHAHVERWPLLAFTDRISAELEAGEREIELSRRGGLDITFETDIATALIRRTLPLIAPAAERGDAWRREALPLDGVGAAAQRLLLDAGALSGPAAPIGTRLLRRLEDAEAVVAATSQRVMAAPLDEHLPIKELMEQMALAQIEAAAAMRELIDEVLLPAANPRRRGLRAIFGGDDRERGDALYSEHMNALARARSDKTQPQNLAADFVSPGWDDDVAWEDVAVQWPLVEAWWAGVRARTRP